jgi:UDP-N-acetylglucosamine 2-epimerase (non-hydrolysing)
VDDPAWLKSLLECLEHVAIEMEVVFPVHPRTLARIDSIRGASSFSKRLHLVEPAPYLEFLQLQSSAKLVVTDSGGVQEETTYLQVPCLTVRENTERPITVEMGTNTLVGRDIQRLSSEIRKALETTGRKTARVPPFWDGKAAVRIAEIMAP